MKTRVLIGLSLALNLGLAVAVIHRFKSAPAVPTQTELAPRLEETAFTKVEAPVVETNSPATAPVFHWSQIASEDLKKFRDNLRAVGCPELTVREIIRAEVNEIFGARRRSELSGMQNQFWQVAVRGELSRRQMVGRTEWGAQIEALAAERRKLLTELLGADGSPAHNAPPEQPATPETERDWLPVAKRESLEQLEQEHQRQLQALAQSDEDTGPQSVALEAEFEQQRRQLLTPEELAELELRESAAANWPENVPGFEPTETEWRAVTRLQLAFEQAQEKLSAAQLPPEEHEPRLEELTAKLKSDIQTALGAERGAAYERAVQPQ